MKNLWNTLEKGLKDYCDKYGFNKVVLGLSGGLDSAICAVLAADVLGGQNVSALMLKTPYTSNLSLQIASQIAALNNLDYHELDITPLVKNELKFLKKIFNKEPQGIVQENLQARLRGQILMAWSNEFGNLVLACSNKSEILTGYCTLYGDTCGGLAPIGNVYKSTLFELADWRNTQSSVLPPEVIKRAPSAELAANQKDEDSLPPYQVLDKILKGLCDNKQSVKTLAQKGFDKKTLLSVQKLVRRSFFKRKQMAPTINIS